MLEPPYIIKFKIILEFIQARGLIKTVEISFMRLPEGEGRQNVQKNN